MRFIEDQGLSAAPSTLRDTAVFDAQTVSVNMELGDQGILDSNLADLVVLEMQAPDTPTLAALDCLNEVF